jgi:hypothetical protein
LYEAANFPFLLLTKSIEFSLSQNINLVTDQVIDTIPLNTSGWGLGSDSDAIYVGLKGNELRALDYYGNKIGSVTIKSRLENFHITPDKIY